MAHRPRRTPCLLAMASLLAGCSDPPTPAATPAPSDVPRWSTAPHVNWAGPAEAIAQPDRWMAVLVDEPGGGLDRIAADPDVATFLNDRFVPVFLRPTVTPGIAAGSTLLVDAEGCVHARFVATAPDDWIGAVNHALVAAEQDRPRLQALPAGAWGIDLPPTGRLARVCALPGAR